MVGSLFARASLVRYSPGQKTLNPLTEQAALSDPLLTGLLLFVIGATAGTLNVLAGGGSMLTLPVLIFLGLPPTVANGTNRVAILMQNVGAIGSFHRHGLIRWSWLKTAALPASLGAGLGAWIGARMGDDAFQTVLALAMLAVALWTILNSRREAGDGELMDPSIFPMGRVGLFGAFTVAGIYGGLVQVGVGFIVLAAATGAGLNLIRGNALKVLVAFVFNLPAIAIYWANGMVDWRLGAALGVGNVAGALLGVRLNVLKGQVWIRRVVTVVVVILALRLLTSA